jgi:hypothetical protein
MAGNAAHDYAVRDAINQVVEASRKLLDTSRRPVPRDQHPKQHGCLRARFVIAKSLESRFRQGLFQEPRIYEAWIRVSNGAQYDDRKPDAHGMAVKLMGVDGPKVLATLPDPKTQDFVLVDNPTFLVRDALEYRRFSEVLLKASGKAPSGLYSILSLVFGRRARFGLTLLLLSLTPGRFAAFRRLIRFASKRIANPLTTRYWSTTPYRFGDTCMKFSAVPADFPGGPTAAGPVNDSYEAVADFLRPAAAIETVIPQDTGSSPDYLREALGRTLAMRGAVFLFQVQLFRDAETTPIDDPTVLWPEESAPFHTVGWIWIPRQDFDTPGRMAFGENLAFTPWHAITAHEPLGEINRTRKEVYTNLSGLRHSLNGVVPHEPQVTDPDPTNAPPNWGDDPSAFWHVLEDELDLIASRRRHLEELATEADKERQPAPAATGSGEGLKRHESARSHATANGGVSAEPLGVDGRTKQARRRALGEHTTGLALSGDGAAGATFSVGFLQGLASLGLIRRLDYISAVAGGSRAAAWLAAWLKREGNDPGNVERQLDASRIAEARASRQFLAPGEVVDEEPQPLRHLRSHASTHFARSSTVATDAWPQILGNLLIHGLVLVPVFMLVVAGARLIVALNATFNSLGQIADAAGSVDSRLGTPTLVAGVLALGMLVVVGVIAVRTAFSSIASALREFQATPSDARVEPTENSPIGPLNRRIATSLLMASLLLSFGVQPIAKWIIELIEKAWSGPNTGSLFSFRTVVEDVLPDLTLVSWPNFLAHIVVFGGLMAWWASRSAPTQGTARRQKFKDASVAAGVTGGVLLVLLEAIFYHFSLIGRLDLLATLVPSLALLVVVAAIVVAVAILGRAASDQERAWWAGLGGLLTMRAIYWSAGMATIFYLPGIFYAAGGVTRAFIAIGWSAMAVLGLLAVPYASSRSETARDRWLLCWASVAAAIFFAGLLGATALFVSLLANMPSLTAAGRDDISPFAYYLRGINGTQVLTLILVAAGSGIVYGLARRLIDVNLFSLAAVESDRLTRGYLAASRPIAAWRQRWSSPRDQRVTVGAPALSVLAAEQAIARTTADSSDGLKPGDDIELRDLRIGRERGEAPVYWGPQLLFNTTMIAPQHGAAGRHIGVESFTLSPLYCGSTSVGFVPTENMTGANDVQPNLWLGPTAALAGSSGEPRISGPLRALATLFSVRTGSWLEKPRMVGWGAASPRVGDLPVPAATGLDNGGGDFLYLTGGVQFERLGVYELIRRRCRFIIAVDGGRPGESPGSNLAQLITRCRNDFGIRIEIDRSSSGQLGPDGLRTTHRTTGRIHYGDVDEGAPAGEFVFVTMAVTGDEPLDVQDYARNVARLGREPIDFWRAFDDRQFECCRFLGDQAARAVFGEAACRLNEHAPIDGPSSNADYVQRLFAVVASRLGDSPKSEGELAPATASPPASPQASPVRDEDRREEARLPEPEGEVRSEPPAPPPTGGRNRNRGGAQPGADPGPSRRS